MKIKTFISAIAMAAVLSGCKSDKKNLNVGTCADYPPFEYFENGEIVGFEIELVKEITKRLGYATNVQDMSFDGIIGQLQSRRIDLAISQITYTPERAQKVDFTLPYYTIKTVLIVKKDSPIASINDLEDKVVGAQFGSVFEIAAKNMLAPKFKNMKILAPNRITDLLQDFKNDRIHALVVGVTEANAILNSNDTLKILHLDINQDAACIALPKNSELTEKINEVIREMQKDGSLDALIKKWKM